MSDPGRDKPSGLLAFLVAIFTAFFAIPGAMIGLRGSSAPSVTIPAGDSSGSALKSSGTNDKLADDVFAVDGPIYECLGHELPRSSVQTRTLAEASFAKNLILALVQVQSSANDGTTAPSCVRDELRNRGDVRGLIVTVAAPVGSTLSHQFDPRVDAIQAAVGTEGYSLDRFYLPWRADGQITGATVREEPGLLLFRRKSTCPVQTETLLVYLVGESPVSGIEEQAFSKAIQRLTFWTELTTSNQGTPLQVVGPCFSGSDVSLAHAIAKSAFNKFLVVTGGATAIDPNRFQCLSDWKAQIFSTRVSNKTLRVAAITYLKEHRMAFKRGLRIAWLNEAGTGFGASSVRDANKLIGDNGEPLASITNFSFPFHLRLMSSQLSRVRSSSTPRMATPNQPVLEFGIPDAAKARDIPSLFTPSQSSPAIEQELRHTLSTIRHGDYDAVGISATDVWDYVALCELISEVCPDKQVILLGASRVFTHPQHLRFMRGCLVASTYVPDLQTPRWSFPWGQTDLNDKTFRYSADSEGTIGLYNAVILSLRNPEPRCSDNGTSCYVVSIRGDEKIPAIINYGQPFEASSQQQYSDLHLHLHQPGAYVSVIGATGFIPLSHQVQADQSPKGDTIKSQIPLLSVEVAHDGMRILSNWMEYPAPSRVFLPVLLTLSFLGLLAFGRSSDHDKPSSKSSPPRLQSILDYCLLLLSPIPSLRKKQTSPSEKEGSSEWLSVRHGFASCFVALISFCLMVWLSVVTWIPLSFQTENQSAACMLFLCGRALIVATLLIGFLILPSKHSSKRPWLIILVVLVVMFIHANQNWGSLWIDGNLMIFALCSSNAAIWCWTWYSRWNRFQHLVSHLVLTSPPTHPRLCNVIVYGQPFVVFAIMWLGISSVYDESLESQPLMIARGLWFARSLDITGGGSLLLTLTLLSHVIFVWAFALFRRINLRLRLHPEPPWGFRPDAKWHNSIATGASRLPETSLAIDNILMYGCGPLKKQSFATFCVVVSSVALWLSHLASRTPCTYSTFSMTAYVWGIGALAIIFWTHTMCQLILLRVWMHKLLRQVTWLPLLHVLPRLPEQVRSLVGRFMDLRMLRPSHLRVRLHYLARLQATFSPTMNWSGWRSACPDIHDIDRINKQFETELASSPDWQVISESGEFRASPMDQTYRELNGWGGALWKELVNDWSSRSPQVVFPHQLGSTESSNNKSDQKKPTDEKADDAKATAFREWIGNAEELVAIQFVGYWHSILGYFYGLIWSAMLMTLLILFAILAYPMHPQRLLLGTVFAMLATITAFSVSSLFAFEGNRVHTLLRGKTTEGTGLDLTVFIKLAAWLLPGTLIILSYAFPGAVDSMLSILSPFVMSPK